MHKRQLQNPAPTPPAQNPKNQFGNRLRSLRSAAGLSQEALADKADVDRTYVSSCERGKRNVSLEIMSRMAAALHISPAEFFVEFQDSRGKP